MIKTKIASPSKVSAELKKNLRQGKEKKVVFTNGCFDILHAGHVTYLEKARKMGDILIVALNTDASTKRLKGPSRPVNTLDDRAKVIAALESVTVVTWFDEDTPIRLIKELMPDVLVKGGDYKAENVVGFQEVKDGGGSTKIIPFLEGHSTSLIIERTQRK